MAPDAESLLQHAHGIRALLRGLLADDARIDDVLQDTWVAALSKGPRAGVPLGPWLKRVAVNFARKLRRSEARRASRERAAARPDETPEARFDVQREVVDELAKLDEPYRSTLILRFFEGLSPKEIAERRGMPAATVRSHLKRGLDRIRERLDEGHGSRGAWGAVFLPWLATRKGVVTGVIVMSVKAKLVLAAVLVLALTGGTAILWHTSQRAGTSPPRAAATHDATPLSVAETEPAGQGATPQPEREPSIVLRGRIVDAATKRVVPDTPLRIALTCGDETLDLVTDGDGVFSGTSQVLSKSALGHFFGNPTMLCRGMAVAVEGYAIRAVPGESTSCEGTLDLGDIDVGPGVPVSGRVIRGDGTGVAGAVILLSFEGPLFPPAYAVVVGRSGADGSFVVEEPVPPTQLRPWTLMALCEEGLGCRSLDVLPGKDRIDMVEIVVEAAAPLDVTVTDTDGVPLAHAFVSIEPRFAPLEWPYGRTHDHSLWHGRRKEVLALFKRTTDVRGRAEFARLPLPGPYDVVALAKGHTKGWQDDVAVDREERRAVTIRLPHERLCAVSGTVLSDEDGSPVAGARVGGWRQTVVTGRDGRFRVEGLDPSCEQETFVVEAEGYADSSRVVPLPTDRDVDGVEIRLERATPVAGRVVDDQGQPVAGVYVDLCRRRTCLRPVQDVGPDGRFVFPDATRGLWKLRVSAPESEPDLEDRREIEVRGGDTDVEVVLRRLRSGTTRLLARVVEAGTGKALDPGEAFLLRRDYEAQTPFAEPSPVERRSGEVEAERVHPDAWRLWVRVPGYASGYVDFTVVEGQAEVQAEVRLGHAGRITGRVAGASKAEAVLTIPAGSDSAPGLEADGRIRGYARVSADGTFVVENVIPGPTTVTLVARGFLGTATADVPSGGDATVEITAVLAAMLSFRSKAPLPEGTETVGFYVSQEPEKWRCVMNLGGYGGKHVSHEATLPAGRTRWRVVFESDGRVKTQEGVVDLAIGQTAEVIVPIEIER